MTTTKYRTVDFDGSKVFLLEAEAATTSRGGRANGQRA